jgi:hypothetical protein
MAHLVKKLDWGDIDLDTKEGRIFFQQKWKYNWTKVGAASDWTLAEKRKFHNTLDKQIWSVWSMKIKIRVTGGDLARRFRTGIPINFDVKWVVAGGHWTVNARKLVPGGSYRSNVVYGTRTINLDSEDLVPHKVLNDAGVELEGFRTVPHEFGHALDTDENPDEYKAGSAKLADTGSIMNIGKELRGRHISGILAELDKLAPGTTFRYP